MLSHKSPEDKKAKQWLEEVIAPYGGQIKIKRYGDYPLPRRIIFGRYLYISLDGITFERTKLCLEGRRTQWRNKQLPIYDWLLACFYITIKNGGCGAKGKLAKNHNSSKCLRCKTARKIRMYLEERRKDKHGDKRRKARSGKENRL